jgi:hypothetical protein
MINIHKKCAPVRVWNIVCNLEQEKKFLVIIMLYDVLRMYTISCLKSSAETRKKTQIFKLFIMPLIKFFFSFSKFLQHTQHLILLSMYWKSKRITTFTKAPNEQTPKHPKHTKPMLLFFED